MILNFYYNRILNLQSMVIIFLLSKIVQLYNLNIFQNSIIIDLRNPLQVSIYGALDFLSVLFGITGLIYVSTTIYELFRYLSFLGVIFLMKIFFGTKYYRHTKAGIYLCLIGMMLMTLSTMFLDTSSYDTWTSKRYFL